MSTKYGASSSNIVWAFFVGWLLCAAHLHGDSSDVVNVLLYKGGNLQQTSTAAPVRIPYRVYVAVNAVAAGRMTSGTFTPPGKSAIPLTAVGQTMFSFDRYDLATQSDLDTAFPNGTYTFSLQTVTPPTAFAPTIAITGDNYPSAAKLLNNNWGGFFGSLQVDATQAFNFSFNPGGGTAGVLRIYNNNGFLLFNAATNPSTTTALLPANTLQPGQKYRASLYTYNYTSSTNGSTQLFGTYFTETYFSIDTQAVIASPLVANSNAGQLFVYQIVGTNSPTSYSATNLPPGLTINTTNGIISGVPTKAGSFNVTVNAIGSANTASATLTINISPAPSGPAITSSTSVTGRTGTFFSFQVLANGLSSTARATATGLPTGLSIDNVSGLISGIPTVDGSFAVVVTITDGSNTITQTLELTVTSNPAIPVITSPSTAPLTPGQFFTYTIVAPAITAPGDTTKFSLIGTLPPGLAFNALTGTISGTPTARSLRILNPTPVFKSLSDTPIVGTVQLVASNSQGTATQPLNFVEPAPNPLANISTRMDVQTGANVMIGGFIVTGMEPKKVVVRALGPTLTKFNVPNALPNPTLELHGSQGLIASNDNWRISQQNDLIATGYAPPNDLECAILSVLNPGSYTAIVRGAGATTGVALVEVYDLTEVTGSTVTTTSIANISTRGQVQGGANVMIGGFIVGPSGTGTINVLVRALGPTLTDFNVPGALGDPVLEIHNSIGSTIASNNNWKDSQQSQIQATGMAPPHDTESAIVTPLTPGNYTAIVRGNAGTTGVALVEVYALH